MGNLSNQARQNMNPMAQPRIVVQPDLFPVTRMAGFKLKKLDSDETPAPGREYRRLGSFSDFG